MNSIEFAGTHMLTRFILKRDKFFLLFWILGVLLLSVVIVPSLPELFKTEMDRVVMGETMKNPAMIALCGPYYGSSDYTNGAMFAQFLTVWSITLWSVMNIFLMVKHTRKDEEEGRTELIKSLPTGRQSNLFAVVKTALLANVILASLLGFGLPVLGVEGIGLSGSILFGLSHGIVGMLFSGIAAVFSQLSSSSKGATGISLGFLGLMFLLRAYGDISVEAFSLVSPLGLVSRTEMYVNNKWWPIFILLFATVLIFLVAFRLNFKRDLQQGLIPARKGRINASPILKSSFGLTFRLLRNTMIAWIITIALIGTSYGSIFGDVESFIETSELIRMVFAGNGNENMTMQFIGTLMVIMSMITTIGILMIVFKLKSEEKKGYIEHLLARSVSRNDIVLGYLSIAVIMSIILQLTIILSLWSSAQAVMDQPIGLKPIMENGLVYLPAIFVFIGLAVAVVGVIPKATVLVWIYLGYSFFVDYVGGILNIPDIMKEISPFSHISRQGVEDISFSLNIVLFIIGLGLIIIGLIGFKRRDIQSV